MHRIFMLALLAAAVVIAMVASGPMTTVALGGVPGTIATFAGGGVGDGRPATNGTFYESFGIAVDGGGRLYIADDMDCRVRLVSGGTISTIAGTGYCGHTGDGGAATAADIDQPWNLAIDSTGSVFIAEYHNCRVRKVTGGTISTVAGTGVCGDAGDGGAAASAGLDKPTGLAVDAQDRLFVTTGCRIRKIENGVITTVAGTGVCDENAPDGPVSSTSIAAFSIAIDASGTIYMVEKCRVRKVSGGQVTSVVAHYGYCAYGGDGGPAIDASLYFPWRIAASAGGDLYIADVSSCRVRLVEHLTGVISTLGGADCTQPRLADPAPALSGRLGLAYAIAVDASGTVYVADSGGCRVATISGGVISTVAGNRLCGDLGDGGLATDAALWDTSALGIDSLGDTYLAASCRVRRVHAGIISTLAGNGGCGIGVDGVSAIDAPLNSPSSIAPDGSGGFFIAEACRLRHVSAGIISTAVGNSTCANSPDGPGTSVSLYWDLHPLATGSDGLYFGDGCRLRRYAGGSVTTVAGATACGHAGDGGPAANSLLDGIGAIAFAPDGAMYLMAGCWLRRISSNGTISTAAGTGVCGYSGDGGLATNAMIDVGAGIAIDTAGDIFFSDSLNCAVREVMGTQIFTVAGVPGACDGGGGDGGLATTSKLVYPSGLGFDGADNLYIADGRNYRIRVVYQPNVDSSGDGYPDALKRALGKNPLLYCPIMRADINMDGVVNALDLNLLGKHFLETAPPANPRVDQNGDNVINALDLNVLAKRFLKNVSACP